MSSSRHSRKRSNIVPLAADPRATNALKYRGQEHCNLVKRMAREGQFPESWCAEMGIAMSTIYGWAARYPEFDEACRVAWTALSSFWTAQIMAAARGEQSCDAKVLMEILRRRFPDTWGKNARNTVGQYMEVVESSKDSAARKGRKRAEDMTDDELKAELERIRASREK